MACSIVSRAAHLLTATLLTIQPAMGAASLALWPEQPAVNLPFRVELQGHWAAGCMPEVESVWTEGRDIHFNVRASKAPKCAVPAADTTKLLSAAPGESDLIAREAGVYRVHAHDTGTGNLLAFALARIGDDPSPVTPETGLWWPEPGAEFANSGPGFGVQVEMQGDIVALTATGYQDNGRATWWFGASSMLSNLSSTPLSALTGGRAPFGSYASPKEAQPAGNVHVEWLSAARAVFWFTRVDAESGALTLNPISMVRFAFGVEPGRSWEGDWIAEFERDAEGNDDLRSLRFNRFAETTQGFSLDDPGNGYRLQCERDARHAQSPPSRCRLLDAAGAELAEFLDIGLQRLRGVSTDGRSNVRLMRLDR